MSNSGNREAPRFMMKHIINVEDTTNSGDNKQSDSNSHNDANDSVYYYNTKTHKHKKR